MALSDGSKTAAVAQPVKMVPKDSKSTTTPAERFQKRESEELVVAFSGPVGSGVGLVIDEAEAMLKGIGYDVEKIKLSNLIKKIGEKDTDISGILDKLTKVTRYDKLQLAGNALRSKYGQDILAELAITQIALHRTAKASPEASVGDIVPTRTAYLIDQLKHPAEVALLRTVYGNLFYLIGVLASYNQRKKNLRGDGLSESEAENVMERDHREDIEHGQQLDKTLKLADLFIRNNHSNRGSLSRQLKRFFGLIHGENGITPTMHEYAMYVAYAAGLKSACLSRQVGAAISDSTGNIIATGCNDVPKALGGLYTEADNEKDHRCVNLEGGKCFNDHHKALLTEEIKAILGKHGIPGEKIISISKEIRYTTALRDLIEYSRSVHAEMDALTSVARTGGISVKNGYLYTTTFPCHNCARHIIAAGIVRVFYIEPYEKSLALTLHDDAIVQDPDDGEGQSNKVQFLHFEGVAPRKYQNFFYPVHERKDADGKAIFKPINKSLKVVPQYLDSYKDLETKVAEHLNEIGFSAEILQ